MGFYDGNALKYLARWRKAMQERVKRWLAEGKEVRIFTARAYATGFDGAAARLVVEDWAEKHLGKRLKVVCQKDYQMIELWDDRAVQVIPNTGKPISEKSEDSAAEGKQAEMVICPKCANGWLHSFENQQAE